VAASRGGGGTLNCKGFAMLKQVMMAVIAIVVFAVIAVLMQTLTTNVHEDTTDFFTVQAANDSITRTEERYSQTFDQLVVLALALFWGVILFMAYFVPEHPILIPFMIFLLIGLVYVGGILTNVYEEIAQEELLSDAGDRFLLGGFFINQLPVVILVMMMTAIAVIFVRKR